MEVNLVSRPGPWSCQVTLRFEYDSSGGPIDDEVLRVPFGDPLDDPDDVEFTLRRAQAAVLNYPENEPNEFLNMDEDELEYFQSREAFSEGTLKFSKNVVCVDVHDSECPDLSFVDLPGKPRSYFKIIVIL